MNSFVIFSLIVVCLALDAFLFQRKNKLQSSIELTCKIVASNFLIFYITYKIHLRVTEYLKQPEFFTFFSWLNWGLVMVVFLFFLVSYLIREPAKKRADRPREFILPLICSILPFGLIESTHFAHGHHWLLLIFKPFYIQSPGYWNWGSIIAIILGDFIIVWGLFYLKRSFSILTEVRSMVQKGPYRWIRHPMYLGESLSILGILFLSPSWFNIIVAVSFIVFLRIRAYYEEQKILAVYPDYANMLQNNGAFLPKISRFFSIKKG